MISQITESEHPQTVAEKSKMLLGNSIAVWDVVGECDIIGSQDNSILNVVPNAIDKIIKASQVKMVFLNGKTAYNLYKKYVADNINIEYRLLPSTSPANATWSLSRLIDEWSVLKDYIK